MIALPDDIRGWPFDMAKTYLYILIRSDEGELRYSRDKLAIMLGISTQNLRTILTKLEGFGYIINEASKQGSKVLLTNDQPTTNQRLTNTHVDSQQVKACINQRLTNDQPTTNQRASSSPSPSSLTNLTTLTTSSNEQPYKERLSYESTKKASLKDRQQRFYDSLVPFVEEFGREMVREFYDYWSEPNRSGTKFRAEMERTWDIKRRLQRWQARDAKPTGRSMDVGVILTETNQDEYEAWD